MEKIRKNLAVNIIRLRRHAGLTQSELAERADLSIKMIQQIEYEKSWPSPESLSAIAKAVGCTAEELLTDPSKDIKQNPVPDAQMDEIKKAVREAMANVTQQPNDPELADLVERFSRMGREQKDVVSRLIDKFLTKTTGQVVQDKKRRV